MTTPPFISACLSMMESSVWEPRRVGGPTRHGALPMRRGVLFFAPFLSDLVPLGWSHVALEVQRDMAHSQCDVACSFYPLFGGFGLLELVPRRVGGPTRHGGLPIRRGALVLPSFWGIWTLGTRPTSRWRPNATWQGHNTTWPSSNVAW